VKEFVIETETNNGRSHRLDQVLTKASP